MSEVADLMKRCQRGVGGRNALNDAHDIMAECYGTLGKLEAERDALRQQLADVFKGNTKLHVLCTEAVQQRDKLAGLLRKVLATHKRWPDLAPSLSLCADIKAALAERNQ